MAADQNQRRRIDIVALVAGLAFLAFSIISLTVGVLDLPEIGAAPLWVLLITAGTVLLVSELRGRKNTEHTRDTATPPIGATEQAAWEQDPYR